MTTQRSGYAARRNRPHLSLAGTQPAFADLYHTIAARLYVSPDLVKNALYSLGYGGVVDPWLKHLVLAELHAVVEEALRDGRPQVDVTPKTLDDLQREGLTNRRKWWSRAALPPVDYEPYREPNSPTGFGWRPKHTV